LGYVDDVGEPFAFLDPIDQTNPYHYTYNNPVNLIDPYGLNPFIRMGIGIGAKYGKKAWQAGKSAVNWVKKNIKVDGPGQPGTREQGRICQIRYKSQPIIRIDYWQYPGTGGEPRLHMHLDKLFPGKHIPLDPRVWFKQGD